jgi:prepilin-type N-terminal cleavage/methylation domain-containing protein
MTRDTNLKSFISNFRTAPRIRRGVGLVELLIALAISASLLTAVAVAVDASFKAYGVNQTQAQLMQRARLSLNRIVAYIRTTSDHRPDDDAAQTDFENGLVAQAGSIRMLTGATSGVIFRQADNRLLMVPFTISGGSLVEDTPRVLLDGVGADDFQITFEPQRSATSSKIGGNYDQLRRASIVLTLRPGSKTTATAEATEGQSITLSTSVMPRRNIW